MQTGMRALLFSFFVLIFLPGQQGWAYIYTLSGASDGLELNQYNETTGDFIKQLQTPPYQIPNFIFTGSNDDIYTVTQNLGPMGALTRYNGVTGALVDNFTPERWGIGRQTMFGPDGDIYSRGNYDQWPSFSYIHKIDGATGAVIREQFVSFPRSESSAFFAFSPDGNIFVGTATGILVYDTATGGALGQLPLPGCAYLTFGPDNSMYGVINNKIFKYQVFDTGFGLGWQPPAEFADTYGFMRFGPDGNLYVANPALGKLVQYDGQTGAYMQDMFSYSGQDLTFTFAGGAPTVTPEPASMALFGLGGAAMAFVRRRMKI